VSDGSFNFVIINSNKEESLKNKKKKKLDVKTATYKKYLRIWVEESVVWGLELALAEDHPVSALAGGKFAVLGLRRGEAEGVNSVRAGEEMSVAWVLLHVFPSGVRPSAWHKLQIFLWNTLS